MKTSASLQFAVFRSLARFASALAAITVASVAHAQIYDVTVQVTTANILGHDTDPTKIFVGSQGIDGFMGRFTLDFITPPLNLGYDDPLQTFCIDAVSSIDFDVTYGAYIKPTADYLTPNGGYASWLYNNCLSLVNSNDTAAGLQIAIWEVVYDGTATDINSGTFLINDTGWLTGAQTAANQFLNLWSGSGKASADGTWFDIYDLSTGQKKQSVIGPPRIPEPGTLSLASLPLLGLAARIRRRSR
jgi:hypothetical protein